MTISNETLKTVASSFAKASEEYRKKAVKYRKALEEIKRVAEEQIKRYPDSFKIKDAEYYTIIEICNEVLK